MRRAKGGVIGGMLGAFGGPVGVAIGSTLGTYVGERVATSLTDHVQQEREERAPPLAAMTPAERRISAREVEPAPPEVAPAVPLRAAGVVNSNNTTATITVGDLHVHSPSSDPEQMARDIIDEIESQTGARKRQIAARTRLSTRP